MAKSRTKYRTKPADEVFAKFSEGRQRKIEKRAAELLAEHRDAAVPDSAPNSFDEAKRDS
jgi:hypothetical protein